MTRLPIRARLTLAFAVAMAVVVAGVGLLVYHRVSAELLASVDETLLSQARDEAAVGHVDADATAGTTLAQLVGRDGTVRASEPKRLPPLLDPVDLAPALHGGRVWQTRSIAGHRGEWRVLALPLGTNGAAVVARSLAARAESLDHLRHELVLILPLALLAASLGGYGLAAGALRPVEAMRRRAEAVTADQPGKLPVPASRDEISRLAVTLNEMLERLHASLEHERRFVADASHELRTPLALLQTELDLALRRPRSHEELEAALRSAADETGRLTRLAEDLLLIARADQGPLPLRPEPVAAAEVLGRVASRFATRAASLGRELRVESSAALLYADPVRIEQALGNLVANALEHGDGAVELSSVARDDEVELHVRDEGPGFPRSFRERAFARFSRADEARSRGGAGLGLSIVELIAGAHGGSAGLGDLEGIGADVWLSVPAAGDLDASASSPQGIGRTPDAGGAARRAARPGTSMPSKETSPR
jgi:signal transduction histidine kinase